MHSAEKARDNLTRQWKKILCALQWLRSLTSSKLSLRTSVTTSHVTCNIYCTILLFCAGRHQSLMRKKIRTRGWWISWSRCMKMVTTKWNAQLPSRGASHVANSRGWICSCFQLFPSNFWAESSPAMPLKCLNYSQSVFLTWTRQFFCHNWAELTLISSDYCMCLSVNLVIVFIAEYGLIMKVMKWCSSFWK